MKRIIILFFLAFISISIFAKGSGSEYFISGKAYFGDQLMVDKMMTISFKDKIWKAETNSFGKFEIKIPWINPCPSGLSKTELDSITNVFNPQWITISYKGNTLEIENLWEEYAIPGYKNKSEVTRKLDFKF